jgi:hypothetical protein
MRPAAIAGLLITACMLLAGCSVRNPTWAKSINPCCGQDLVLQGIEPPEDRCADIVVDQSTARRLMADIAQGNAVTQWHVRFIPGGPACIWYEWPGLTDDDFLDVEPPGESDGGEAALPDTSGNETSPESERGKAP